MTTLSLVVDETHDKISPTLARDENLNFKVLRLRPSPLVFVKDARYEKLMEAFGGVGVHATTPEQLRSAMEEAIRSRKPTLINAIIDEAVGTESGRITSLNPTAKKT